MSAHPEIEITRRQVLSCFEIQRRYLAAKPAAYLEELQHRCEDLMLSPKFSVRTAAEINRTACVLILEGRR